MKKIINGKRYDTDTAREIGCNYHYEDRLYGWAETLYLKKSGEYFLFGEGGPGSRYARAEGSNSWANGWDIFPMTFDEAKKWTEKNLDAKTYEENFGVIEDDETAEVMTIKLPASTAAKIRRRAQETGKKIGEVIAEAIG